MLTENIAEQGTSEREMMLRVAVAYMRRLNTRRAEYEAEVLYHARRGHRPHYCIHGTNMWTDYDNICGGCEDGYTDQELALMWAKSDVHNWIERFHDWITFERAARNTGSIPHALLTEGWKFVNEAIDILDRDNPRGNARPVRNLP